MKRLNWLSILLALLLLPLLAIVACGDDDDDDSGGDDDDNDDDNDSGVDDNDDDDDDNDDDNDDDDNDDNNDDDDDNDAFGHLIPGPSEQDYDAELEDLARLYDRQFHAINAYSSAMNADVVVPPDNAADRELLRAFLQDSDGWDFEAHSGKDVFDVVTDFQSSVGLYGGVGIAADAYRYGVLRDQGYAEVEVDLAREHLVAALEAMHIATAITGVPGVIARAVQRLDVPMNPCEPVPLFDEEGNPLPLEKNNGTCREDNSGGEYANWQWIDSCSRDMYIGWMAAFGAAWEVIRDDEAIDAEIKDRLQEDARLIGLELMVVRPSGFDLEIIDADGRTTFHGYMNENNYDRLYLPFLPIKNGMYSLMALGSVAALAYVTEDAELESYLYDTLIGERRLDAIARHNQIGIDLWVQTNYSSVNMAFMGGILAARYLEGDSALDNVRYATEKRLYDKPGWPRQPAEQGQSLYDFITASAVAGSTALDDMTQAPDAEAMAMGLQTLKEFPTPPFWERPLINCDEAEIQSKQCTLEDGTEVTLLGYVGRGNKLVSREPIPMRTRPPSNYFWRTNPYEPNGGGDNSRLIPGVDFRYAYWLGRWAK